MTATQDFGYSGTRINLLYPAGNYLVTPNGFKKTPRRLVQVTDLPNGYPIAQHHEIVGWDWSFEVVFYGATYDASNTLYVALHNLCVAAGLFDEFGTGTRVEYREQIQNESSMRVYKVVDALLVPDRELVPGGKLKAQWTFTTRVSDSGVP